MKLEQSLLLRKVDIIEAKGWRYNGKSEPAWHAQCSVHPFLIPSATTAWLPSQRSSNDPERFPELSNERFMQEAQVVSRN